MRTPWNSGWQFPNGRRGEPYYSPGPQEIGGWADRVEERLEALEQSANVSRLFSGADATAREAVCRQDALREAIQRCIKILEEIGA